MFCPTPRKAETRFVIDDLLRAGTKLRVYAQRPDTSLVAALR